MQANDFVSMRHIMAEVTKTVNDEDFRSGFSPGWYTSRIQDALQELAFDTFFQILTRDFDFPSDSLTLEMPKDCFNIREIYLYNGDCCSPQTSVKVYWKRQYNNNGKGEGYTASVKLNGQGNSFDPFMPSFHNGGMQFSTSNLYYANVQNGMIMFGSNVGVSFNKVRLVYNGMGGEIGDEPIIPRFFERAVNDYVKMKFYDAMKSRDSRTFRVLWADAKQDLSESWYKAEKRIKTISTWEFDNLNEYISGIYHK